MLKYFYALNKLNKSGASATLKKEINNKLKI